MCSKSLKHHHTNEEAVKTPGLIIKKKAPPQDYRFNLLVTNRYWILLVEFEVVFSNLDIKS